LLLTDIVAMLSARQSYTSLFIMMQPLYMGVGQGRVTSTAEVCQVTADPLAETVVLQRSEPEPEHGGIQHLN
jgi:hypothetical protein